MSDQMHCLMLVPHMNSDANQLVTHTPGGVRNNKDSEKETTHKENSGHLFCTCTLCGNISNNYVLCLAMEIRSSVASVIYSKEGNPLHRIKLNIR